MRKNEQGIALIAVLILMGVLSVIASSLMFVAQSETWASQNYRLMSEARYSAESAVHRAANHLIYSYTPPNSAALASGVYTRTASPVTYNGAAVRLGTSGATGCASNYPVSADVSAFQSAAAGTLAGSHAFNYDACAILVSMRELDVFPANTKATIQTWRIVGEASLGGNRPARTEVEGVLERQVTPTFKYAAFAHSSNCDALIWSGGATSDSYDSSTFTTGTTFDHRDSDVGTNGSLTMNGGSGGGGTAIYGGLSTPRTGVGNCTNGNVTAFDLNGQGVLLDGVLELPQTVTYPDPTIPAPIAGGDLDVHNGDTVTWDPSIDPTTTYGDVDIHGTLRVKAGTYNINTLKNLGTLVIVSGPVVFNITDVSDTNPLNLEGGALTYPGTNYDASMFQILYKGTQTLKVTGNSVGAGLVYAPKANVEIKGGADFYGAIIGNRVDNGGGGRLHYDRRLGQRPMMLGAWMIDSFTWSRF